jgi:flagellar basal body-associated protein FliL
MFARNLFGAVVVALFASMVFSCVTTGSADAEPVSHTQLPLEMSHNTMLVQTLATNLVAAAN